MFSGQLAGMCKYDKSCKNRLCSFQHKSESEVKFACQQCEVKFPTEETMTEHVVTQHENENNDGDEFYSCEIRDNVYNEIEELIDHYRETAHNYIILFYRK